MRLLQIIFLTFTLFITINAQKAVLSGIIYDHSGGVIGNAEIYLKDQNGNKYNGHANDEGHYRIEVPIGIYSIKVQSIPGIEVFKIKKYRIAASAKEMILDISLMGKVVSGDL